MKIAIVADIHGNSDALQAVLNHLPSVDLLVSAGDVLGYYPFFERCLDLLIDAGASMIQGNHEAYLTRSATPRSNALFNWYLKLFERTASKRTMAWLNQLPPDLLIELPHGLMRVFHGSPWSVDEYVYEEDTAQRPFRQIKEDIIVLAHTHIPMDVIIGNKQILNPGSVGQPRRGYNGASYILYDSGKNKPFQHHKVIYDPNPFISALREMSYEDRFISAFLNWDCQ
ncbi:MAG: metallophosphoesterase family protein [Nitrospirota bacterium]